MATGALVIIGIIVGVAVIGAGIIFFVTRNNPRRATPAPVNSDPSLSPEAMAIPGSLSEFAGDSTGQFPKVLWILPICYGLLGGTIAALFASLKYAAEWWQLFVAGIVMQLLYGVSIWLIIHNTLGSF